MLLEDIFRVFQYEITSEKIKEITEEQILATYNLVHESYIYNINLLGNKPANIEDCFSWYTKKLDINIVYYNRNREIRSSFFFSKSDKRGTIYLHDLTAQQLIYEDLILEGREFIAALIEKGLVDVNPSLIIESSIFSEGHVLPEIGRHFFDTEYRLHVKPLLQAPSETVDFNNLRIHKDIYDFEEMIKIINNPQFAFELEECLGAYENEKFFLCAAGLGSVLEHILYLSIEKWVHPDNIHTNENSTASEYVAQLRKEPFRIDRREGSHIKNLFAYRNSVSHFNKGIFSKEMCDNILAGIKICFERYYMYQPKPELT